MSMRNELIGGPVHKGVVRTPRYGVSRAQRRGFERRQREYIQAAERLQREQRAKVLARIGR
jgi:hypothetical protein